MTQKFYLGYIMNNYKYLTYSKKCKYQVNVQLYATQA